MLLVNSRYPDANLTIDDSCAHCAKPLRLTVRHSAIQRTAPAALYLWGGGT